MRHDFGQIRRTFNVYIGRPGRAGWHAATGERTVNQAEAEGWSETIRRRTERIFGVALLILLIPVLVILVCLFLTGG